MLFIVVEGLSFCFKASSLARVLTEEYHEVKVHYTYLFIIPPL